MILDIMANTAAFPVYKPSIDKYADKFTQAGNHITNGAFKLKDWVINAHIELEKNQYYWDTTNVRLDKVKYFDIEQPMQEFRRYQSGQVDTTSSVPTENINYIKRNFSKELLSGPYLAVYYYGFNVKNPPMDNLYLRKALSLAVDRKIITDKLLRMGEIPQQYYMPKNTKNYKSPKIDAIELDDNARIIEAKKAFAKTGYNENNPVTVTILYNTMDSHKQIAVLIAAMWKSILGVKTELVNAEWKVFLKDVKERKNTQIFRQGIVGDFNDAYSMLENFQSDSVANTLGYENKNFDILMDKAKVELDIKKRQEYLQQAEKLLLSDYALMPLYTYTVKKLVKPYVGGFNVNFMNKNLSKHLYLKYNKENIKQNNTRKA